jgi:hypothetical protein
MSQKKPEHRKTKKSKSQIQTTHSSPNLFTQPSQFTAAVYDENTQQPLNQLRRLRAQQEENLVLMRSRLAHLIKKREKGEKRIQNTKQDIN